MPRPVTLKDVQRESRLFQSRAVFSLAAVALACLGLVIRLTNLQVLQHDLYVTLSTDNRVKVEPLAPTRGLIYDRKGKLLAENQPAYSLELIPEQVDDVDATIAALREIITIEDRDVEHFHRLRKRKRRFESIPIRFRLNEEEVSRFAVHRHAFPGVDIHAGLYRYYPMGELTAHVLGYVGRIDERELQELSASEYAGTSHVGKVGVEKTYEAELHGKVGFRKVETNAQGRVIRVLERTPPIPGEDLHLNLDLDIQRKATEALGEYNGAIVALDPRDGAVLALVSKPGYDPNPFVNGISVKDYNALNRSRDKPLFNRVLRGQYPPGSTIKPLVGLGGLEFGVTDTNTTTFCPGYFRLPGSSHRYRDWKRWGHGAVNLDEAITQSCDVYFYQLALNLGIDRLSEFLGRFGLGKPSGIDLTGELGGLNPSREWKRRTRREAWYPGETLITGIGQGYSLATPLQLAQATALLSRRGMGRQPRVVKSIEDAGGNHSRPPASEPINPISLSNPEDWQTVIQAMIDVVHGSTGTARHIAKGLGYTIAGKTGTAQVYTVKQDEEYDKENVADHLRDHALFVGFAPADEPTVAVAVVVENGGSGGSIAAPVARQVFDAVLGEVSE
ncbi:MAG: penicillin-binding protein 2 [Chromatiales bacterium]|nr:penicillin-binding protein 2 [Chromatiales bacterium]